jgi:hypothetical protein
MPRLLPAHDNKCAVLGASIAVLSLAGLVVVLALLGQAAADSASEAAGYRASPHESVAMHAAAMVAVATVAVGVAVALCRAGWALLAAPVLAGVALGPMTVVAAPLRASLIDGSGNDTTPSWHLAVGGVLLVVLSAWTWWTVRSSGHIPAELRASRYAGWPLALFAAAFLAATVVHQQLPEQVNTPAGAAIIGWQLLASGIVTAVAVATHAKAALFASLSVSVSLGLIALAYTRTGGWPAVAGWEAIQPPIVTCWVATGTVLAAPFVGLLFRPLRRLHVHTASVVALT